MLDFEKNQTEGSPHHFLKQLAGNWSGQSQTWFEPGGSPVLSKTQGSIQILLDGRFAIYIYQSVMDGEPQHGMFIFGYNTNLDRYEASWIDSFHNNTAIMFCTGDPLEKGFWVRGSYPDPSGGPDWDWRTEVSLVKPDDLTITAFNIMPEGQEARAIETLLKRVTG